jgi:putative transcriptional regulator
VRTACAGLGFAIKSEHCAFTTGDDAARAGDQVGVTRQTVNAIEGGKYSPSLEVAFRIARVLKKPLEEVFQYGAD